MAGDNLRYRLRDIAEVIRSKNAGPFQLTIDIMFPNRRIYEEVKKSGVVNAQLFADLYRVPVEQVTFTEYDEAMALKGTIPRAIGSGDFGDTDVYGAQQHAPLLDVEVPLETPPTAEKGEDESQ